MRTPTLRSFTLIVSIILLAAAFPASAQENAAEGATPAPPPVVEKSLLDLFNAGGALMWPILLCSIGTIAVGVYCFLQISPKKMMPPAQVAAVSQYMQRHDANSAYQLTQSSPNVFANTMSSALLKVNFERELANKVSMEQAAGETLVQEETRLMIWVNYLNIFATIAPMLGLLGTVTGMIQSFDQLAAGRSEPQDLAGGIGEAMLTTAGGLIVGIPAMFLYFYFRNLLQVVIGNIQKSVTFMIDVLSGELKLDSAAHAYEQAEPEQTAE
ncbi:MAG: MotA/TolQ/ExbB proton channel family protein [Chthoniobacterales bacterium]|nr:MotA/TolQ/ExbB proton channel family protein [Chthoniobacterales bacterium]